MLTLIAALVLSQSAPAMPTTPAPVAALIDDWQRAADRAAAQVPVPPDDGFAVTLRHRVQVEQAVRQTVPDFSSTNLTADEQRIASELIWARIAATYDAPNTAWLQTMLPAEGWFLRSRDGAAVVSDAWLIVQHSPDRAFQNRVLRAMEPLVVSGEARGSQYALLYDRVALQDGRPQRYGSQMACENGQWVLRRPVEDETRLDERRAAIGLDTIAAYRERMLGVPGC